MKRASALSGFLALCLLLGPAISALADDWPQWNGPHYLRDQDLILCYDIKSP
ncbi:MAG TPA: hypothetical protein VGO67_10435 [Verrucomicrobiae bacterium]|jgi:hypothetical protein